MREIDTLTIAGGGLRSIAAIGSLIHLRDLDLLKDITKYAGVSAGSIISTLLVLDYTPEEILELFLNIGKYVHDPLYMIPYNLICKYGMYNGNKMITFLGTYFTNKGHSKDITFLELFNKTQKELVMTGTSISIRDTFYFGYKTFPDMKVLDAIRISASIPLYFTSVNYTIDDKIHVWCDGGLLNNYPLYYFDNPVRAKLHSQVKFDIKFKQNTIGILLVDPGTNRDPGKFYEIFNTINNISDYINNLIETTLTKIQKDNFSNPVSGAKNNFFNETITIPVPTGVNALDFNIKPDTIKLLIDIGKKSVVDFMNYSNNLNINKTFKNDTSLSVSDKSNLS